MRLMWWVASAAVVVFFGVWFWLEEMGYQDNLHLSDAELRGEGLSEPWYQVHPLLTALGTTGAVVIAGSVVVIAIKSERRDP